MEAEAMKAIVVEALYKGLDEKKREELIKGALAHLIQPQGSGSGSYGTYGRTSPLQDAWNMAASQVARDVVRDEVNNNPEVRGKIAEIFTKAWTKALANEDAVVDKVAEGIISAMRCHLER